VGSVLGIRLAAPTLLQDYPRAHPGSKVPLGWTLSKTAMKDLREQLGANGPEIRKARRWFSSALACKSP
jgi:hypothetical protein